MSQVSRIFRRPLIAFPSAWSAAFQKMGRSRNRKALFSGFPAELTEVNQLRISSLNLTKFSKHASQHIHRFVTVNSRITKS
jgi:hypothetical protein